jgi:molecular chaperone GrpE (heat shock protein)
MNESDLPRESSNGSGRGDAPSHDEIPQFGAVDIVEAFTAMRHEWRGQTKESRALAEQLQAAVMNIQSLGSKLLASVADNRPDDSTEARQLALLVAETDHQLSRAVAAIALWEMNRRLRQEEDAKAVESCFARMSWVARWFARPLLEFIGDLRPIHEPVTENPATEGLNLVLARLRRAMCEHAIERLEVEGQPFDATTMHAIGTVASTECPSGHVLEQLSPAYRWQSRLLRFADVRVAK